MNKYLFRVKPECEEKVFNNYKIQLSMPPPPLYRIFSVQWHILNIEIICISSDDCGILDCNWLVNVTPVVCKCVVTRPR